MEFLPEIQNVNIEIVIHETLNSLVSDVYNINILFSRKYSIGHEYIDTKYYLDNDDQ